eukprot:COSAG06_NODE_2443_length_6870_cov_2.396544_5_plen_85_part_00
MRKTTFLSHFYVKTIILPRQARDKHRNHSAKKAFCAGPNDYVNADISDGVWVQDEPFLAGKSIKFNENYNVYIVPCTTGVSVHF